MTRGKILVGFLVLAAIGIGWQETYPPAPHNHAGPNQGGGNLSPGGQTTFIRGTTVAVRGYFEYDGLTPAVFNGPTQFNNTVNYSSSSVITYAPGSGIPQGFLTAHYANAHVNTANSPLNVPLASLTWAPPITLSAPFPYVEVSPMEWSYTVRAGDADAPDFFIAVGSPFMGTIFTNGIYQYVSTNSAVSLTSDSYGSDVNVRFKISQ